MAALCRFAVHYWDIDQWHTLTYINNKMSECSHSYESKWSQTQNKITGLGASTIYSTTCSKANNNISR